MSDTSGNAALAELTALARILGIPASVPRTAEEVRSLGEAVHRRISVKARVLAFAGLEAGQRDALDDAMDGRR